MTPKAANWIKKLLIKCSFMVKWPHSSLLFSLPQGCYRIFIFAFPYLPGSYKQAISFSNWQLYIPLV